MAPAVNKKPAKKRVITRVQEIVDEIKVLIDYDFPSDSKSLVESALIIAAVQRARDRHPSGTGSRAAFALCLLSGAKALLADDGVTP